MTSEVRSSASVFEITTMATRISTYFLLAIITRASCAEFRDKQIHFDIPEGQGFFTTLWEGIKVTAKSVYNSIVNMFSTIFVQPVARGVKDALTPEASAGARLYRDVDEIFFAKGNATNEHGEFPQKWVTQEESE